MEGILNPRNCLAFFLRFERRDGVHWIRNDLCVTGLTVKKYPARKVTRRLTNFRCILVLAILKNLRMLGRRQDGGVFRRTLHDTR